MRGRLNFHFCQSLPVQASGHLLLSWECVYCVIGTLYKVIHFSLWGYTVENVRPRVAGIHGATNASRDVQRGGPYLHHAMLHWKGSVLKQMIGFARIATTSIFRPSPSLLHHPFRLFPLARRLRQRQLRLESWMGHIGPLLSQKERQSMLLLSLVLEK